MSNTEKPTSYRCWWYNTRGYRPFDSAIKPKSDYVDYVTEADARAHAVKLAAHFGDDAAVSVTPLYLKGAKLTKALRAQQLTVDAGWPIQRNPKMKTRVQR